MVHYGNSAKHWARQLVWQKPPECNGTLLVLGNTQCRPQASAQQQGQQQTTGSPCTVRQALVCPTARRKQHFCWHVQAGPGGLPRTQPQRHLIPKGDKGAQAAQYGTLSLSKRRGNTLPITPRDGSAHCQECLGSGRRHNRPMHRSNQADVNGHPHKAACIQPAQWGGHTMVCTCHVL
jgi:hypothetical protein